MTVNIEDISNLKHRAVVQALLTTELSPQEILNRLQIQRALFYYIVNKYLPKDFLSNRKKKQQMQELSALSQKSKSRDDADSDMVTVLDINPAEPPMIADESSDAPQIQYVPQVFSDEIKCLITIQRQIFREIDKMVSAGEKGYFPSLDDIENHMFNIRGKHPGNRDTLRARKKWIELHPQYKTDTRQSAKFQMPAVNRWQEIQSPLNSFSLDYRGLKFSCSIGGDNSEV